MPPPRSGHTFTVIEPLIVIVIIAVHQLGTAQWVRTSESKMSTCISRRNLEVMFSPPGFSGVGSEVPDPDHSRAGNLPGTQRVPTMSAPCFWLICQTRGTLRWH